MASILDFLSGGHDDGETPCKNDCCHSLASFETKIYGFTLQPSEDVYQERVAAFRFKPFPESNRPRITTAEKYVHPVLDIFHTYLAGESCFKFTSEDETFTDRDCVRIHKINDNNRELHIVLHFMSPGQICWAGILPPRETVECSLMNDFFEHFKKTFLPENPRFFLISDGQGIIVLKSITQHIVRMVYTWLSPAANGSHSLRHILCLLLCQMPDPSNHPTVFNPIPWRKHFHGAMNLQNDPDQAISPPLKPSRLKDFDRFTLQRSFADLEGLLDWKDEESQRLSERPLVPGTSLSVSIDAFRLEESLWRCPFPNPPIQATTRKYVGRNPRPRLVAVDQILVSGQTLDFRVTKVVRHQSDSFSQVFLGVLYNLDGVESPTICLKLFVDALFPVDEDFLCDDFDKRQPRFRLSSLHYAEDLVRREEAAYDRLKEHQGSLIPHCYGFHRFTVKDSIDAYGVLLEVIPGPSLGKAEPSAWDEDVQRSFIRHLRECQRALLYAGVDQGDYHGEQILLPAGPGYRPETDSIVLIDFAFAVQRFGDEQLLGVAATLMKKGKGRLLSLLMTPWGMRERVMMDTALHLFSDWSMQMNEW
ncbi:hypothetical protein MIND_00960800 [Mycena indigotica]|uniref:Uncharacterized protein n=1 Tax=Mycena indigotica TaxID=2126181 RepID=A0A8H6SD03_9AGAR|nr:uncharacterized protein MIND_00960800 [Mycena indigotica]KAF7297276.1 hypothetical protein MIND_00960800 [Mycena indigotica]